MDEGFKIDPNYMKHHRVMARNLRVFLIKYLYKISIRYKLKRTTMYLATFYFDKFLESVPNAVEEEIYLAVQASMLIAMKYEEIYPPELAEWAGTKAKKQILDMEAEILKHLDFKLAHFTCQHFLEYECSKNPLLNKPEISRFILHLMDLTLFDEKMYDTPPSVLVQNLIDVVLFEKSLKKMNNASKTVVDGIKWML